MSTPVDVFIVNYNGGDRLLPTVKSVLAQTYANKRVILSDNNSTDGSPDTVRHLTGLEYRTNRPGTGDCYGHYNSCLPDVRSPYVAFFHNDDLYEPTILEKQIALMEANPALDAVLTAGTAIGAHDEPLWPIRLPKGLDSPILNRQQVFEYTLCHGSSFLICPSALFRTSTFERLGLMRADLVYCGDMEMWLRILFRGGGLGYLDEPLIRYRMAVGQGSSAYELNRTELSEFFTMSESYIAQYPVSSQVRESFEALKRLDLFQAGLNRLAKGQSPDLYFEQLQWLTSEKGKKFNRKFGAVDRLRILGARAVAPLAATRLGPVLARWVIRETDPRRSFALRSALKLKRA